MKFLIAPLSILPEDIFDHIFSYLDNKTAIQLSLLSKELFSILQRRPVLVFDHENCSEEASDSEYEKRHRQELNYIVSTLERYQEQNIHLQAFTFKENPKLPHEHHLFDRCIRLSIQKGITNLNLSMAKSKKHFLPQSVFEGESLVELSLKGCSLQHPESGRVAWHNLKRLRLCRVCFWDDGVFEDIIRGINSLLIECLEIHKCKGSKTLNFEYKLPSVWNAPNLKKLVMYNTHEYDHSQTLEWNAFQHDLQVKPKNLKSLWLTNVRIGDSIFFNFPQIEELNVRNCQIETIKVSSLSLRKITLVDNAALQEASFDVPNIVDFRFVHSFSLVLPIPKLSFRGNSSGWVSHIETNVSEDLDLLKLKLFLAQLNSSEITTKITFKGEVLLDEANLITLPGPNILGDD